MSARYLCALLLLPAAFAADPPTPISPSDLLARMMRAEDERVSALDRYTALRRYVLVNTRFNKRAEVVTKIVYSHPGSKEFSIVSESGPGVLRNRVLRRMIEAETEGSRADKRELTRVSPDNYNIRILGAETVDGHTCHVIELDPKSSSPYLIRGKAWVDAQEYAVVRLEGVLKKNPSFWTRETRIEHRYAKHGPFWLPASNRSTTDARLFGDSEVTIESYDYQITERATAARAARVVATRPGSAQ